MSFDWKEYYELARMLSGESHQPVSEEAKQRASISRAYYAAIIQARALVCKKRGERPPFRNTHKWTIDHLRSSREPTAQQLGDRLSKLKKRRDRADYDDYVPNLRSEWASALVEAERILNSLRSVKL